MNGETNCKKTAACLVRQNRRARRALGKATPISADCGLLCKKACCRPASGGDPGEYGMLLFPGEERLLKNDRHIRLEKVPFRGKTVWFATCDGHCDRRKRPLACRIFPLLPYIPPANRKKPGNSGGFSLIPDPRAKFLCPLISHSNHVEEPFYEAVHAALVPLLKCGAMRRFIFDLSAVADGYLRFI